MLTSLADDLPLLLVAIAAALHVAGERRAVRLLRRPRDPRARWRALSFYAGLLMIVCALKGPIDDNAATLFWVHMLQHVLLMTIAAPLIVLGAPWNSTWRPLPLGFRRATARAVARSTWAAPLRAVGRGLGSPAGALLAFSIDLVVWHIPGAYDLTLRHIWVHALEHTTFMVFSILLWAQVLDSPPLRSGLALDQRVYYMLAAATVGWVLSLVLTFAPSPLYPAYAAVAHRPGGISALADQQLAGGMMLGPGSLTMTLFVFIGLYRWLGTDEPRAGGVRRRSAPGTGT